MIRQVLGLDTVEPTLIPDRILPLCSDRDRNNIMAMMMAVGMTRGRGHGAAIGGWSRQWRREQHERRQWSGGRLRRCR